jgi:two-component system NtrC family response regulator
LYYRLSVIDIRLPSLRERGDDIVFLGEFFLRRFANELHRPGLVLSRAAKAALVDHTWPGNVRELEHRMQRAALLTNGRMVQPDDLELVRSQGATTLSLKEARDEAEARLVVDTLRRTFGNISRAARELDVSRPTLHDLLRKHGIDARHFKSPGAETEEE